MSAKKASKGLLAGGLFDRPFMDSKVTTNTVSTKEWVLGHLIGPLGLIFVVNSVAALVEKFFTQQTGAMYGAGNVDMIIQMGSRYEVVMTVTKILGMGVGLLNGWLIQNTKSRQGRMRPWHLIFGFITIIIGALIFLFPGNTLGESYWYYFFFLLICFHTIGSSYFYLFRDNICSLTTRDPKEKAHIQYIRKMSWTLISGIIIGMLLNMVALPMWLEKDINGYPILLICMSVVAIPLLLLEYFYTRERISEDVSLEIEAGEEKAQAPLKDQLKALLSNKYFVIMMIITTVGGIVDNYKGGNVQYFYIKFLLGGVDNPLMFTIYQVITGSMTGIGAFIIYPLAKKVGIKNLTVGGYALVLAGSVLGWLFPDKMVPALVAGFLRNVGMLPNAYIFATLTCYAFDSVEYKSHMRLEGMLGVAVITAIQTLIYAPFAGGYESGILRLGFVDAQGVLPTAEVTSFMTMSFYLLDIILAVVVIVLLPMVDVEKKMPVINEELYRRKKEAVLARGEVWVDPEEQARIDALEAEKRFEENRIADLKARCEKKGLDFETENAKYQEKKARKEARQAKKK
ncbi:MAG: MFS transporter [Firmicutes bacterium]|nr:MFS transporter [Bacillota bacterium]